MTTLEILRAAYHLLDDKKRWTRGRPACDEHGRGVPTDHRSAVSWCAAGAIVKASGEGCDCTDALELLQEACGGSIAWVNDGPGGYRRVRAAFRKAIRRLEQQAAT